MSDDEELLFGPLGTQFNVDNDVDTENRRQKLKRKAIDDEVTDEKGRPLRFHGAFTGGFHAGHFDTVGSKEGFIPQQYVSKGIRGNKVFRQQKPEDFMDEEDFSEHGIAPKLLKTKAVFDDEDIRKHFKQSLGSNSIIGDSDILKDILIPQRLTIGMVLLKKLGYTASHGVGENDNSEETAEIQDENRDLNSRKVNVKFNYEAEEIYQLVNQISKFGLGYSGIPHQMRQLNTFRNTTAVNFGLKNKRGITGTAFGVGVDEDEDDFEDFFGQDSMAKYNFEINEDTDDPEMNRIPTTRKAIMEPGSIMGFQSGKRNTKNLRVVYDPPKPTRFYVPIYPVQRDKEKIGSTRSFERPKLMPSEDSQSVFSLISLQDRERLFNLGQECRVRKSNSRWGDAPGDVSSKTQIVPSDHDSIESSPKFYKPSETSFRAKKDSRKSWSLMSNIGMMFKSAGSSSETQDINYCLESVSKKEKNEDLEESTQVLAASQENYGFMTRIVVDWHPDKLLCKRFNIADPYPGSTFSGVPDEVSRTCDIPVQTKPENTTSVLPIKQEETSLENSQQSDIIIPKADEESNSGEASSEVKTTILDLSTKPEINLFKAVFADSDAEFSSSEDEAEELPEKTIEETKEPEMSIVSSLELALTAMIGGNFQPSSSVSTGPAKPVTQTSDKMYGPPLPPGFAPNSVPVANPEPVINHIISRNIRTVERDPIDEIYDYKEKSKTKKSKKEKKSKKKSKKKKTHHSSGDV